MDSVDIVHEFSGQTGQCTWTLSTESMDRVQGTVDNLDKVKGTVDIVHGHCSV